MLMKLRNFQEALAIFEQVLVINPLLSEGSLDESMRMCRNALENSSTDASSSVPT
jgi:hypothetical protein